MPLSTHDPGRRAVLAVVLAMCGGLAGCGCACSGSHGTLPADDAGYPPPVIDAGAAVGPLRIDLQNRRYFTAGAGAIYLTGSHTWGNFKDRAKVDPPPAFNYAAYLDFLVAHHHNFFRLWTWEQPHSADDDPANPLYFTPFPWPRTGPGTASDGKPCFDLDQFDDAYFTRLHDRAAGAGQRGIYVSIMLFDGWDLANGYNAATGGWPMAAGNNINSVASTPAEALSVDNRALLTRQENYVRRVVDAVADLDNVLFEIANETNASAATLAWQNHMIDFLHGLEADRQKQHPVGMTAMYPGGQDKDLFASSADWISPTGATVASDGRKVIINDTDHSYGWQALQSDGPAAQRAWAWKNLCVGASTLFMDPYLEAWAGRNSPSGARVDTQWENLRNALGHTRLYADRLDLERAVPLSTHCSTGYCLVEPGHQYLVYQPASGSFTVNLDAATYRFEWFNPATGRIVQNGMVTAGAGQLGFTPPFPGDAVLLLLSP
jgi:hypothetical protein